MSELSWQAWLTLGVLVGVTVGMVRERLGPDLVMFCGLAVLVIGLGVWSTREFSRRRRP